MGLEGDAEADRDRSGARGPRFASLIGRKGLTYCFGAA